MSYYTFTFDNSWLPKSKAKMNVGLTRLVTDIHNKAVRRAPVLTGALVNSGRYRKTGPLTYQLTFGNARVPYAVIREYVNRKHPTTRFYLGNSVKEAEANPGRYFGDLI